MVGADAQGSTIIPGQATAILASWLGEIDATCLGRA
jgi:hypothetical protein